MVETTIMDIDMVQHIKSKGLIIVCGMIKCDYVRQGQMLLFKNGDVILGTSMLWGIETFNKSHDHAVKGTMVGFAFRRSQLPFAIEAGMRIVAMPPPPFPEYTI